MRRVLFRVFGVPIHSYPAMLYVGLVLGTVAGNYAAHIAGLDGLRVFIATLILIIPSLGGARLLFLVTHWNYYKSNPSEIWNLKTGGMSQYGGILLAVPISIPLLSAIALPFGAFWDVASFTILVGMIFTRFGCLLNGCCAGRESTAWYSMRLPNRDGTWAKRNPTQIMEAMWATSLLVASVSIWQKLPFDGALFVFVAAGYALGRLVLESLRDLPPAKTRFTIQHAISLFIIAVTVAVLTGRSLM
jgi:phosphatidylglycerol:prolipoprotein diacylglycerol transferase